MTFPDSIPAAVQSAARRFGEATYVIDGDIRWSFADAEKRMLRSARALIARGIQHGDRVALLGPNCGEWIEAALGIHAAGAVLVPLNTRYKRDELEHILRKSGATFVFSVGDFLGLDHVGLIRSTGTLAAENIVVLDDAVIEGTQSFTDFLAGGDAIPEHQAQQRIDAIGPDDLSDILFTSGTTGAAKGVRYQHGPSVRVVTWLSGVYGLGAGEVHAVVPPFFHVAGYKAGWFAALISGAAIIPLRTFDTAGLLALIEEHRVSVIFGPPTMFVDIIAYPDRARYDISSLRSANVASAGSPTGLVRDMHEILGFDVVFNAYGQTEANGLITTCRADDPIDVVAVSVGRAIDDVEVIIVDDDGKEVPRGVAGEVMVRGYNVMDAYWEEPEATAATIRADGFLHTGDIGTMDEQGYLRITDRKKDMYIVGGFNAYPAEIEAQLTKHPGILHAAVIGVPDERMGEVGWAYVIPKPGQSLEPEEVIDYAREHLANFKVPRRVLIVDELPRNPSMKVLKFELRKQALELLRT